MLSSVRSSLQNTRDSLGSFHVTLTTSHTHTRSLSHTHTLFLSHSLSLFPSVTHTHTHTCSFSLTHSLALPLSHTLTHTHTHTLFLSLSLSLSLTHSLTRSLSIYHTHTHARTKACSHSRGRCAQQRLSETPRDNANTTHDALTRTSPFCTDQGPILFAQNSVFLGGAWSFTETRQKEWFFGDGARVTSEQLQSHDPANGGQPASRLFSGVFGSFCHFKRRCVQRRQ